MLKIYIARHGQNEDNVEGILNGHRDRPLTARGREQAHELADGISEAGLTFDAIYASPLCRAYDTAKVVAERLGLAEPIVMPDLIERDFGIMTGTPVADIEKTCAPDIIKTDLVVYFLSPEGAERYDGLLVRARRVHRIIEEKHIDGSVLLVTHGDIGKMLYAEYYKIPWQEVLPMFHFGNSELLILSHDTGPEETHVVRISQHNH